MRHTVTFTTPPALDEYKDPVPGEPETIEIPGCIVAPTTRGTGVLSGTIRGRAQATLEAGLTVYTPPGAPSVPHRSTAVVEGYEGTWEMDGEPADWTSGLTGWDPGGEIVLRKAGG